MKTPFDLARYVYSRSLEKLEKSIGCKLVFHTIPDRYINGIVAGAMTGTWRKFGLDVEAGANHWTVGRVASGISTRYDRNAPEYQSWLGGYTVRLGSERMFSFQDHFRLAIADQNGWLRRYGDPKPLTSIDGWNPIEVGKIKSGNYEGTLYEFGCTTHSDVGRYNDTLKLRLAAKIIAQLFKVSNPKLILRGSDFLPRPSLSGDSYEIIDLKGFIAIFDIKPKVKVVLYANGALVASGSSKHDTFETLREDLLRALRACEIIEL